MRLRHKLVITFSLVSLVVMAGVAGLLTVDKVGKYIGLVLEGKVGVADASIEAANTVTNGGHPARTRDEQDLGSHD
ncbi:MAG: hypothetical protein V3R93_01470 [Candidatus Hydrothermarchaeaceae archaeon]